MIVNWIGLLPVLFAIAYAIERVGPNLPVWAKLLIETSVLVPTIHYVITPTMERLFSGWLHSGSGDPASAGP